MLGLRSGIVTIGRQLYQVRGTESEIQVISQRPNHQSHISENMVVIFASLG